MCIGIVHLYGNGPSIPHIIYQYRLPGWVRDRLLAIWMRREFPIKVRVAVIKRATAGNKIMCEKCNEPARKFQIDHIVADGLCGPPTIENAMLICDECYAIKNSRDTSDIARAKRIEAKHIGADRPKQTIHSRGFQKTEKRKRLEMPSLPPRQLYVDIKK